MTSALRAALAVAAALAVTAPAAAVELRGTGLGTVPKITVSSTSYAAGSTIAPKFAMNTCGAGAASIAPELSWTGAPAATKSFVITEFDPNAPTGVGFWHWTLYNIPASVHHLAQGAGTGKAPGGGVSGLNDYGGFGYGGPCPPPGDAPHHYVITVSALDTMLSGLPKTLTGAHLEFAMRGHVIAQGTYIATYAQAK